MKLFVLSELHPRNNHVGWSVSCSLEETLASACDATFVYPTLKANSSPNHQWLDTSIARFERYKHRLLKSWFEAKEFPTLGKDTNVLLIVGLGPYFLLSMYALGPLLRQFDLRLGYILDGFDPQHLDRAAISQLDHLFVMNAEIADDLNQAGMPTTFLPLATNTLGTTLNSQTRWIDIISYGRGNAALHQCLQTHYNQQQSDRIYYHSTFSRPEVNSQKEHIVLLSRMLTRSKISICIEASDTPRFMSYSPILYRWFEAWAAGCTIVGKRPFGRGTAELMDWENSAIDIPDSPTEWIPFFEALVDDQATLAANARRNYRECLLRHDWRYRLRDIFTLMGLDVPTMLNSQIAQIQEKAHETAPLVSMIA